MITYFAGHDVPVFLLNVFAKGDRVDLTPDERNVLRDTLGAVVKAYRRSTTSHAKSRT